jgi:hypothetical protein
MENKEFNPRRCAVFHIVWKIIKGVQPAQRADGQTG